jgi:hypothetical protein
VENALAGDVSFAKATAAPDRTLEDDESANRCNVKSAFNYKERLYNNSDERAHLQRSHCVQPLCSTGVGKPDPFRQAGKDAAPLLIAGQRRNRFTSNRLQEHVLA